MRIEVVGKGRSLRQSYWQWRQKWLYQDATDSGNSRRTSSGFPAW